MVSPMAIWSAWTAARSMLPTRRRMNGRSVGPAPAAAAVPFRKSASSRWWRTARTCCSAARWRATERVRSRWPKPFWVTCSRACCAWRTGSFFGFELWNLALEHRRRSALADQEEHAPAVRSSDCPTALISASIYPSERDRRRKTNGVQGARHRLLSGGRCRCRADLPARHHDSGSPESSRPRTGRPLS